MGYYSAMKKNKPLIHLTIDDSQIQYTKQKKPNSKEQIHFDSIHKKSK